MINPLIKFKYKKSSQEKDKRPQTRHPWFLEKVQNGLKATNIREYISEIRANKKIPIQYFEYDRIFGQGAFENILKVTEMLDELKNITPRTKGFIYNGHKYWYHNGGILRIDHESGEESFFSNDTLQNENVACYLVLVYSKEEEIIESMINELSNATDGYQDDTDRRRISG